MPKYAVSLFFSMRCRTSYIIEATNEDEAMDKIEACIEEGELDHDMLTAAGVDISEASWSFIDGSDYDYDVADAVELVTPEVN
jgi:hypothetical protein